MVGDISKFHSCCAGANDAFQIVFTACSKLIHTDLCSMLQKDFFKNLNVDSTAHTVLCPLQKTSADAQAFGTCLRRMRRLRALELDSFEGSGAAWRELSGLTSLSAFTSLSLPGSLRVSQCHCGMQRRCRKCSSVNNSEVRVRVNE